MIVGAGDYRYERVDGWAKGRTLGIASGVATDSEDRVYVIDREPNPVVVIFGPDGTYTTSWGEGVLTVPHDIWIDAEDRVYIADSGDHTVRIFDKDGYLIKTFGKSNQPGDFGTPFNKPTRAVCAPNGDMYVSDGYGQYHVHRFSPEGRLKQTWGGEGSEPGRFSLPHNVYVSKDKRIIVADREPNHRIQVFDLDGAFLAEWPGRPAPCGLFIDDDNMVYIAEGAGVSILTMDGRLIAQWVVTGGPNDRPHGAHGIWVDSQGSIFVGEVGVGDLLHKYERV